jgi:hypothetical protein
MLKEKILVISLVYAFGIGLSLLMMYIKYPDFSLFIYDKKVLITILKYYNNSVKNWYKMLKKDDLIMNLDNEQIHNL